MFPGKNPLRLHLSCRSVPMPIQARLPMKSPLLFPRAGRGRKRSSQHRMVLLRVEQLEDRRLLSRSVLSLDDSWQFIRQDVAGAGAVAFDDSAWKTVSLPHTWNNL